MIYIVRLSLINYLGNYLQDDYYFYGRNSDHPAVIISPKNYCRYNKDLGKIIILPL